jgi:hypothetical protein
MGYTSPAVQSRATDDAGDAAPHHVSPDEALRHVVPAVLSSRTHVIWAYLRILAQDRVPTLTVRTAQRKLQCAQPPDVSLGSFNPGVNEPGGGRTSVDQHKRLSVRIT